MRYGQLGGELIAKLINDPKNKETTLKNYLSKIPEFKLKHFIKKLYNKFNNNIIWKLLFKLKIIYILAHIVFFLKKRLK